MDDNIDPNINMYPQKFFYLMKKFFKRLFVLLVALIVLCVGIGAGWYFIYYPKTPEYSLKIIQTSIKEHDLYTFEKHVDIDALSVQIVEGYVSIDPSSRDELKEFMQFMRDYAVSVYPVELEKQIRNYVKDPKYDFAKVTGPPQNLLRDVNEKTRFMDSEIQEIAKVDRTEKTASVHLLIQNKKTQARNILIVRMQQMPDTLWRVTDFVNLQDYMKYIKRPVSNKGKKK